MVYGILRLINFAHGDVFMVAGLMGIYLTSGLTPYLPRGGDPGQPGAGAGSDGGPGFCIERVATSPCAPPPG